MAVRPDYIPEGYDRIAVVDTEEGLFAGELSGRVNCILLPRAISGDFNGLAKELYLYKTYTEQRYQHKGELYVRLSRIAEEPDQVGQAARVVKGDVDMVRKRGLDDNLRVIDRDFYLDTPSVQNLHMDIGQDMDDIGALMCSYTEPTTGWAMNEECDEGLRIYRHDPALVFNLKAGAQRRHFQPGDMFRQAAQKNLYNVKGFIHGAESIREGELRLMLVAYGPDLEPSL